MEMGGQPLALLRKCSLMKSDIRGHILQRDVSQYNPGCKQIIFVIMCTSDYLFDLSFPQDSELI